MKIREKVCWEVSERDSFFIKSCPGCSRGRGQANTRDSPGGCRPAGLSEDTAPWGRTGLLLTQKAGQGTPCSCSQGRAWAGLHLHPLKPEPLAVSNPKCTRSQQLSKDFKPHNCLGAGGLLVRVGGSLSNQSQILVSPEVSLHQSSYERMNLLRLESSGGSGGILAAQDSCHLWQI